FRNGVLSLPDVPAAKVRLTLAENQFPEAFAPVPIRLGSASGVVTLPSRDLALTGPDGATVWAFPGEYPPQAPNADVDLRLSIKAAFDKALAEGQPLDVTFRLSGATPGRAGLSFGDVH